MTANMDRIFFCMCVLPVVETRGKPRSRAMRADARPSSVCRIFPRERMKQGFTAGPAVGRPARVLTGRLPSERQPWPLFCQHGATKPTGSRDQMRWLIHTFRRGRINLSDRQKEDKWVKYVPLKADLLRSLNK